MTKYAVLISGDWAESGFDEFWNDVVLMREMLLANNFEDRNIFILYADGDDFVDATRTYARYDPVAINRPPRSNRPASFTDYPATRAEVQAVFDGLANGDTNKGIPEMTENDFLFVWTFDHGGTATGGHSTLGLVDINIRDDEFAGAVDAVPCRCRVFCMQQCHSGGFIDDLSNNKTVILTACRGDESAWPANNTPTQEDEIVNGVTYNHGEFNYHLISALLKQAVNGGAPVNADTTGNGLVSMLELFNYVEDNDNGSEHPQYDDGSNDIGGDVHIEKEKEVSTMMKIAAGETKPDQWQQYPNGKGIFVDVDTSSAKFSKTPIYITAIHGTSWHWNTSGASSVYNASPTGFRIYIRWTGGAPLTPDQAKTKKWRIQWIGIEG